MSLGIIDSQCFIINSINCSTTNGAWLQHNNAIFGYEIARMDLNGSGTNQKQFDLLCLGGGCATPKNVTKPLLRKSIDRIKQKLFDLIWCVLLVAARQKKNNTKTLPRKSIDKITFQLLYININNKPGHELLSVGNLLSQTNLNSKAVLGGGGSRCAEAYV